MAYCCEGASTQADCSCCLQAVMMQELLEGISECSVSCAGMIKVVGIVILSALFLGESSIFTTRQASIPSNPKGGKSQYYLDADIWMIRFLHHPS